MPGLTHFPACTKCGIKNGHTDDCPNRPRNPWIEDELKFIATLLAEPEIMKSRVVLNLCCERAVKLKAGAKGEGMRGIESGKAMYQENMENELATLRARLTEVENKEAERWAQRLNWLHTEYGADCSGVDSGDPLDCVEVEIRQVVNRFSAALAEMTERARVLGEAALKIHKRSRYERCHAPDTYSCAGNQLACDDCEYNDCGCPACTIAREVVKENS